MSLRRAVVAMLLALAPGACARDTAPATSFRGVALSAPLAKPSIVLTDVNGQPYDFTAATKDKVALLFFGYTHCPDICPLHMANISAVLKRMPAEDRARIVTVFVTTDPERDTPERLKQWIANFDPSFVALTGTTEELARAQQAVGLSEARREYAAGADSANYFVGHGAQVFAFARDGFAYTIYPFGIRQEDWANDLPKLVSDATGARIRRDLLAQAQAGQLQVAPGRSTTMTMGGFIIERAVVAEPVTQDEAAAYVTFRNETAQEDTLVAIAADLAVRAEVHATMGEGEMRHMMAKPSVTVPARSEVKLMPGGDHIMLLQLRKKVAAGDSVTLYLSFSRIGAVEVRAPVVPYAELEMALGIGAGSRK